MLPPTAFWICHDPHPIYVKSLRDGSCFFRGCHSLYLAYCGYDVMDDHTILEREYGKEDQEKGGEDEEEEKERKEGEGEGGGGEESQKMEM